MFQQLNTNIVKTMSANAAVIAICAMNNAGINAVKELLG